VTGPYMEAPAGRICYATGVRLPLVALVVSFVLAAACSKAGEESQAKRTPVAPPPVHVEVPAELSIPVKVDGVSATPITGERLAALAPDFADDERRAWKLTGVLGADFEHPGAVVHALGPEGVAISMTRPEAEASPQPVLLLTRRGDVIAAVVDPANPFPVYHGHGGRLRRPGDPRPRLLTTVVSLRVESGRAAASAP
jgi:hypothetical protein